MALTPLLVSFSSRRTLAVIARAFISTLAPLTCWYVSIYLQRRSPKSRSNLLF